VREDYERWLEQWKASVASNDHARVDLVIAERLRAWISNANSSSQALMEGLSRIRGLNEKTVKQLQNRAPATEVAITAAGVVEALRHFEKEVGANIQEDQRIIVVDAGGFILGLVVDHVNEVLNISKKQVDPPPQITSSGLELSGIAKLNDGSRLIMLLDIANLMRAQKLRELQENSAGSAHAAESAAKQQRANSGQELSELQLVTFLLGGEEYGVPISQIQEIDRLSKITKVPKAARFVEGVTNLRGEVIPVLDTRRRFDLEVKAADDRTRIIIVELGGVKTGLVVDAVREVLSLSKKDIAPPPEAIHTGVDQRFISGIGKVDNGKRMIVLLDVEKILSKDEQSKLAEVPSQ
jgi:purine-binding chemotaxis protein CheW